MLVRGGRVQALPRHLDRLAHSMAALYAMGLPRDLEERVRAAAASTTGEHRLRVDVVPGEAIAIATRPVPADSRRPVTLAPLIVPGGLGPHKWRDRRLLDIAPTPLLVDADGAVMEGAWGNLWLLDGDALITPPADGRILPGVTRALLLELAPALGYHAHERPITLDHARRAPVAFMTSAIRLAVPATLSGGAASPSAHVDRIRTALAAHF
jgi:para-aminobenzoate synthetase / 4-amino-4-deoxychorismate lyase